MTMASTTIRIDYDTLPDHFDRSRPDAIAVAIEDALREDGIAAEASNVFSHLKIEVPTRRLPEVTSCLRELEVI